MLDIGKAAIVVNYNIDACVNVVTEVFISRPSKLYLAMNIGYAYAAHCSSMSIIHSG